MDDELPKEFDLIVVGTGFTESIVAAAASRIGKTVLHLDPNEFYGSCWASFNLESFQNFIVECKTFVKNDSNSIRKNVCNIESVDHEWQANDESSIENDWTKEKILKDARKFNIDLVPKLLFSCGKLVELLITSNISRYAEFRAIDNVCTIFEGQMRNVPCSRTDVFNSKDLTIIEKRLLMKLLSQCMSYEENPKDFEKFHGKTFLEFLQEHRLTEKIVHCVLHSISMSNENTSFEEGMDNIKKFLHGLGRYGNTPFLFPMYGCGEIPQCFCRLCAVFGGLYCLKKQIEDIQFEEKDGKNVIKIINGNQIIETDNLIIGNGYIPREILKHFPENIERDKKCGNLARAIFILSSPIGSEELNSGGGGVNFLRLPNETNGITIIQLSHYSGTCPKGLYLLHITGPSLGNNPKNDLKPAIDKLFDLENPPKILYSVYFKIPRCLICDENINTLNNKNVHFTCGPFSELDYDLSIENAKNLFNRIYKNEEFLPRAPDPEEIVMGDEDPTAPSSVVIANEKFVMDDFKEKIKEIEEGIENELKALEEKETINSE